MQPQPATPEQIAGLLDFEARAFDHLEAASDLSLVAFLFDTLDRIPDQWLRVELDAVATVACSRWARPAFNSFEANLTRPSAA